MHFCRSRFQYGHRRWREACGALKKTSQFPDLFVIQRCAKTRHSRQANTILDFPVDLARRVVNLLRVWPEELWWMRIHSFRDHRCRLAREPMADRAVLAVDLCSRYQRAIADVGEVNWSFLVVNCGVHGRLDEEPFEWHRRCPGCDWCVAGAQVQIETSGNQDDSDQKPCEEFAHRRGTPS